MPLASPTVLKLLGIMSVAFDRPPTAGLAELLAEDLGAYPEPQVLEALSRCRRELTRFPTLAEIIQRIPDGRPGPEEAWALLPKDEATSVVWTQEMAEAFDVARHLLEDDPIQARMAFKETYTRFVAEARSSKRPTVWTASLGHDKHGRERVVLEAIDKGRLAPAQAVLVLGHVPATSRAIDVQKLLPDFPAEPTGLEP